MRAFVLSLATAAALAGAAAQADTPSDRSCFSIRDWRDWKADATRKDTFYIKVRMHDVYRVQLTDPEPMLQAPMVHLVSKTHGPDMVCNPIDLDLKVSDSGFMTVPVIVKTLTRLTPEEVAALPEDSRP